MDDDKGINPEAADSHQASGLEFEQEALVEKPGDLPPVDDPPVGEAIQPFSGYCPNGSVSGGICTPFENVHRSTWMSSYASARHFRIMDCTLPGTHNSGFDKEAPYTNSPETCQDVSPFKQLMTGIRVLDLRVSFINGVPAGHPGRFMIFHSLQSGRNIQEDILDKVLEFHRHTANAGDAKREIVILDFHEFRGFDDAAHRELAQLIKNKLEPYLIPPWLKELSISQIWGMGVLNVVIAYHASVTDPLFWGGVNQRWIGEEIVSSDVLKKFMDQVAAESKPWNELRSIQCAKYIASFPVPVPDDISSSIGTWFYAENSSSYINKFYIINTDWSLRQRLVDNCIHAHTVRLVEPVFDFSVPQSESVTLPAGHRSMKVFVENARWARNINLPLAMPSGNTIVIYHNATLPSHVMMNDTDINVESITMINGDVLAFVSQAGHWRVLRGTDVASSETALIRSPRSHEKIMGFTLVDGGWIERFRLPDNPRNYSYVWITSSASLTAMLSGENLAGGNDIAIQRDFKGLFIYSDSSKVWSHIEVDEGDSAVPVPGNFHLEHNNYYPIKLLWNASAHAVKYRVYRWFTLMAEVTGTEYQPNVQGYNRFHLKAVDAAGRESKRTGHVFFYPPS